MFSSSLWCIILLTISYLNDQKQIKFHYSSKSSRDSIKVNLQQPEKPFAEPRKVSPLGLESLVCGLDAYVDFSEDKSTVKWPKLKNETLCKNRADAVKKAFQDAWIPYVEFAFGHDEVRPISKGTNDWLGGQATTIVDGFTTMAVMGLKDEMEKAMTFLRTYSVYRGTSVSLFETSIRILAGLISSYDLTGDVLFLRKAEEIGDIIITQFENNKDASIPYNHLSLTKPSKSNPFSVRKKSLEEEVNKITDPKVCEKPDFFTPQKWEDYNLSFTNPSGKYNEDLLPPLITRSYFNGTHNVTDNGGAYLAEFGLFPEFVALSDRTGDPHYAYHSLRAAQATLHAKRREKGMIGQAMDTSGRRFTSTNFSIQSMADSFYEYLIKQAIYLNPYVIKMRDDDDSLPEKDIGEHWIDVMDAFAKNLKTGPSGRKWIADWPSGSGTWQHLACFAGGNYAIGAYYLNNWTIPNATQQAENARRNGKPLSDEEIERIKKLERYIEIGKELSLTCFEMYNNSRSGVSGEDVNMNDRDFANTGRATYYLRPEAAESLFYLYRVTGDPIWQDRSWQMFQNIEKACKLPPTKGKDGRDIPGGYTSMSNTHSVNPTHMDEMPSFFLAETLKYLYLIHTDPSTSVPLDKWVFTTEAHPLACRRYLKRAMKRKNNS